MCVNFDMSNAIEIHVASQIRAKKLAIKFCKRKETVNPDEVIIMQGEMEELLEKYNSISDGKPYMEKSADIAHDFCDDFFYELSHQNRDVNKIGKYYDIDATLSVVGKDKFVGKFEIASSIAVRNYYF